MAWITSLKCIKCDIILTDENWLESQKKIKRYVCKECNKKIYLENKDEILKDRKNYYIQNKSSILIYQEKYRKKHSEKIKQRDKKYRRDNKDKLKKYSNNWRKENSLLKKTLDKKYYDEHKDKIKIQTKKYRITNKDKINQYKQTRHYKELKIKHQNKRNRELNTIPLNKWFEGCEGHHIDSTYIVYIPEEIHRQFYGLHRVSDPISMISINHISLFFIMQQNIKEILK